MDAITLCPMLRGPAVLPGEQESGRRHGEKQVEGRGTVVGCHSKLGVDTTYGRWQLAVADTEMAGTQNPIQTESLRWHSGQLETGQLHTSPEAHHCHPGTMPTDPTNNPGKDQDPESANSKA
mmetsp:Transcript_142933/g.249381  ORF Transcript_142933/g.249381 Transcript_142933/m.249381 type:complete len:122 (-) Transcript_142933:738-1103(-)